MEEVCILMRVVVKFVWWCHICCWWLFWPIGFKHCNTNGRRLCTKEVGLKGLYEYVISVVDILFDQWVSSIPSLMEEMCILKRVGGKFIWWCHICCWWLFWTMGFKHCDTIGKSLFTQEGGLKSSYNDIISAVNNFFDLWDPSIARSAWTTKKTMLKSKPHLVRFHKSIFVSLWTFLPTLVNKFMWCFCVCVCLCASAY